MDYAHIESNAIKQKSPEGAKFYIKKDRGFKWTSLISGYHKITIQYFK